jgi:hypothetical protein
MQLAKEKEQEKAEAEAKAKRKAEAEEIKRQEAEKARISFDLMEAVPFVRTCNGMSKEMNHDALYEVKLIPEVTPEGGMVNMVCIRLSNSSGASEMWSLKTFHSKYGMMQQEFLDNKERLKNGQPLDLDRSGPFFVSHHSLQTIGHIKVVMQYVYHMLEFDDSFAIISQNGSFCGTCTVRLNPKFTDKQNAKIDELNDKMDEDSFVNISELNWDEGSEPLDLEIEVVECKSLPRNLASDVRVSINFPRFVGTVLLPTEEELEAEKKLESQMPQRTETEVFLDVGISDEEKVEYSAVYTTPMNEALEGQITINPKIGYKRTIRIVDVTKKVIQWLEKGELILTVSGEIPDAISGSDPAAAPAGSSGGSSGGSELEKLKEENARLKMQIESLSASAGSGAVGLSEKLASISAENARLAKELAEAKKQGSSACTIA